MGLVKLLKEDVILANIDEWTVSFKTSENYSWTKGGTDWRTKNLELLRFYFSYQWKLSNGIYFLQLFSIELIAKYFYSIWTILRNGTWVNNHEKIKDLFVWWIIAQAIL